LILISCGPVEDPGPTDPFITGTKRINLLGPSHEGSIHIDDIAFDDIFHWNTLSDSDVVLILGVFDGDPSLDSNSSSIDTTNLIAYGIDGKGIDGNMGADRVTLDNLYEYNAGFTTDDFDDVDFPDDLDCWWGIWGIKGGEIKYSSPLYRVNLRNN